MGGSSFTDTMDGPNNDKTTEVGLESKSTVAYLVYRTSLEAYSTSMVWSQSRELTLYLGTIIG